jgi:hypothetical protein
VTMGYPRIIPVNFDYFAVIGFKGDVVQRNY